MEAMQWWQWAIVVLAFLPVYVYGVYFTAGIRLWPRWRDDEGQIRLNPFHIIEAVFWPVAWPAWAWLYWYFWQMKAVWRGVRAIVQIPWILYRILFRGPKQAYQLGRWINDPN